MHPSAKVDVEHKMMMKVMHNISSLTTNAFPSANVDVIHKMMLKAMHNTPSLTTMQSIPLQSLVDVFTQGDAESNVQHQTLWLDTHHSVRGMLICK